MFAYTVDHVRAIEEAAMTEVPEGALMQRAAAGLASVLSRELIQRSGGVYGAKVLIMVGPGNNGGDALYAGQRLARRGAAVTALRCVGTPHPEGLDALLGAGGRIQDLDALGVAEPLARHSDGQGPSPELITELDVDLAVDGIFGIGGRPGLPEPVEHLVDYLQWHGVPVVSVDLPSGVDCDTGAVPAAAVRADLTVTFGVPKIWQSIEPARSQGGRVELIDIGLEPAQFQPAVVTADDEDYLTERWPFPGVRSDKYSRGVVGIDTGSEHYPGAALLSTQGSVHAGAGMVRFLGADAAARMIGAELPNVVFASGRVQAHLLGSGWGDRPDGDRIVAEAVESGLPLLIDADGLRHLPAELPATCLLTPHAGELARLLGCERPEVETDPITAARAGADRTGATVLLKGATQVVAQPGRGDVQVAVSGPAWTAQAGSGDVLAGVCATLLAAGIPADQAGVLGASLQAITAAAFPGPLPPHELASHFPEVLGRLQRRTQD